MIKKYTITLVMLISCMHFSPSAQSNNPDLDDVRAALQKITTPELAKSAEIEVVSDKGIYDVVLTDGRTTGLVILDGRVVLGDIRDQDTMQLLDMLKLEEQLSGFVETLPDNGLIEFKAQNEKASVVVFTDVDCGYCRRLHANIEGLNKAGITVRYTPYPRGGVNSESLSKMQAVYCSQDPQQAMTDAKQGKPVESQPCDIPVEEMFVAASKVGVSFTPLSITSKGKIIRGWANLEEYISSAIDANSL